MRLPNTAVCPLSMWSMTRLMLVFFLLATVAGTSATRAAMLHVPEDFPTIQLAIDAAASGDEVVVAPGTYTGEGNRDISYREKELVVRSSGGSAVTIIDCEATAGDLHRGFLLENLSDACVLDGFTITGGYVSGDDVGGGGIYCRDSSVLIRNCVIDGNSATGPAPTGAVGGGVRLLRGTPQLVDCVVTNNHADGANGHGGGIAASLGGTIRRCTIRGNTASADGGGLYTHSFLVEDCVIEANDAFTGGGAFAVSGSLYRGCRFYGNDALAAGGIEAITDCVFENCLISGNRASAGIGGGIYGSNGPIRISGCTISGNQAHTRGGGIFNTHISSIESSIVWGNCAGEGGDEIAVRNGSVTLSCAAIDSTGLLEEVGGTILYVGDNVFDDPLFCGPRDCEEAPTVLGEYSLCLNSPCLAANGPESCEQIGALGLGCEPCGAVPTRTVTWGGLKTIFR